MIFSQHETEEILEIIPPPPPKPKDEGSPKQKTGLHEGDWDTADQERGHTNIASMIIGIWTHITVDQMVSWLGQPGAKSANYFVVSIFGFN